MLPLDIIIEFEKRSVSTFSFDWECVLEQGYRRFLTAQSCVIDVGGHAGRHAQVFVDAIGCRQVTIFEPLTRQYKHLARRFARNPRVRVLPFALSSESGRQSFVVNQAAPQESGLRERVYNDPARKRLRTTVVEVSTLDDLSDTFGERIDYIKIDTEGAEIDILRGAARTLARHQPIVSVEFGLSSYTAYGHHRMTLFDTAAALDYTICDLFGNPFDREQWDNVVDRFYWDYYLVPNDMTAEFHTKLWDGVYRELETRCWIGR